MKKGVVIGIIVGIILIIMILLIGTFILFIIYAKTMVTSDNNPYIGSNDTKGKNAIQWINENSPREANFAFNPTLLAFFMTQSNLSNIFLEEGETNNNNISIFMNEHVLTADSQTESLEFLYNRNASHLFIDSSDIEKYSDFSSEINTKNNSKPSSIGTFLMEEKMTDESKNESTFTYLANITLDEDIIYHVGLSDEVLIPEKRAVINAIRLPVIKNNDLTGFGQPYALIVYNGKTYNTNLRYISIEGQFQDFNEGLEGCAFIIPQVIPSPDGRISMNSIGAIMYLSPRVLRGFFAQEYLLNDPFKKYPNFKLIHLEQSDVITSLKEQGMPLPEFIYFNGVQGPLKIWEINYTGNEKINPEYVNIPELNK